MNKKEKKFLIALAKFQKIGSKSLIQSVNFFGSAEKLWSANSKELRNSGLTPKKVKELTEFIRSTDPEEELRYIEDLKIETTSFFDKKYPKMLKEIFTPPFLLYHIGKLEPDEECLAVVGSRKPTDYGIQTTKDMVRNLAQNGLTIVSGLALGIDSIAHQAVVHENARTIAVLGNGLDQIYPSSNRNLAKDILRKNGTILTEFPPGTPPLKQNFPARNRIISGMSKGVLITEAAEKSGSLITARDAIDQNREIFAIPGNIYSNNSKGPNNLIKMGAKVVTDAEDILEELNLKHLKSKKEVKKLCPTSLEESKIIDIISEEPRAIDEIVKISKIETHKITSTITLMELKGIVKNQGGVIYLTK